MRTLVVYYSRTGITRNVAEAVAAELGADSEEIRDTKNRDGALRFIAACKDGVLKKTADIMPPEKNPADYDLVVVGSPVWAKTMTPAVRAYLEAFGDSIGRAATFATADLSGLDATNRAMAEMIGGDVAAAAGFRKKYVKKDAHTEDLRAFIDALRE